MNEFHYNLYWDFARCLPKSKKLLRIRWDHRGSRYLLSWSWVGWNCEAKFPQYHSEFPLSTWVQPKIVDAANIVCNFARTAWHSGPKFCRVERPLRVTLHIWARTIPCHLEPALYPGGGEFALWTDRCTGGDCGEKLEIKVSHCFTDADTELQHHLISFASKETIDDTYLLVQGDGILVERLELVRFPWTEPYISMEFRELAKEKYFQIQ